MEKNKPVKKSNNILGDEEVSEEKIKAPKEQFRNKSKIKSPELNNIKQSQLSPGSASSRRSSPYTPVQSSKFYMNVIDKQGEVQSSQSYSRRSQKDYYEEGEESPVSSEKIDVLKYYNEKKRDEQRKQKSKYYDDDLEGNVSTKQLEREDKLMAMLEKLQEKIDKQDEIIKNFTNKKKTYVNVKEYLTPQDGSTTDEDASSETNEEDKIPDYENMDPEECEKYYILFETNFELLKKSYSSLILTIPKVRELSLRSVHIIYCNLVNVILVYQLAMKFKVIFIAGCAAVEYYGNKKYKIKVLKNITRIQLKRIDKYSPFFIDCARSVYNYFSNDYPEWMKFVFNAGMSVLSFLTVQSVSIGLLGLGSASEELLKEADRFVSPSDGKFKFKDDGIPDVPPVPQGMQDPEKILKRVPGIIDFVYGEEDPVRAEEIPKEKKQEHNYDEVY